MFMSLKSLAINFAWPLHSTPYLLLPLFFFLITTLIHAWHSSVHAYITSLILLNKLCWLLSFYLLVTNLSFSVLKRWVLVSENHLPSLLAYSLLGSFTRGKLQDWRRRKENFFLLFASYSPKHHPAMVFSPNQGKLVSVYKLLGFVFLMLQN